MPSDLRRLPPPSGEEGYILVMVLVTMLLLVMLGLSSTRTTTVELQVAGNDKINKQTFYQADAGTEVGSRLTEENVSCPSGFTATSDVDGDGNQDAVINGNVVVDSGALTFWRNEATANPSDTTRDLYYPPAAATNASIPHTNIVVFGETRYQTGAAIQMVAGYEGKGKGAGAGGGYIRYTIVSQRRGVQNSLSEVEVVWRHVIGLEGQCNY